jgi:FkbM family methyltransferase
MQSAMKPREGWLTPLISAWRGRGTTSVYDLSDGHSIEYRPGTTDNFVIREIWENDEYFLDDARIQVDGPIVDIGAHIGVFSVRASILFPGNPIVACEPVPANFALLKRNLARNRCRSVTPLNMAVAAKTGSTQLYLDASNTGGHSTAVAVSENAISVNKIGFGDLVRMHHLSRISFLKVDCEGGEYDIMLNPDFEEMAGKIDQIVLEYHPVEGHDLDEVATFLRDHGLEITAHKDGYFAGQGTALFQRVAQPASSSRIPAGGARGSI